jgi:hypothetical protein
VSAAFADGIRCLTDLRVGAPVVDRKRIVRVPIHLQAHDGSRGGFELQWRYPEETFAAQPDESALANLFTLTTLLPILNYMPFCREVRIEGPLDTLDLEWLHATARATFREIHRQKFTPENPFLRPELLPQLRHDRLEIPALKVSPVKIPPSRHALDEQRTAVLLEGTAEGLLSWAMLEELGAQPLGIFYEWPGRGLGAAINTYEYLTARKPDRAVRIWTNLPLLYDFFLRHLDFLRPNFQTIHADTTPLRVFEREVGVFSALPVLWARKVRHVVMAHPADLPDRRPPGGALLPLHVFDQTRFFEDFITRFFARKGWAIQQWSPLRSASELILQRTLGTRYPELFPLQVSCLHPRLQAPPLAEPQSTALADMDPDEDIEVTEQAPEYANGKQRPSFDSPHCEVSERDEFRSGAINDDASAEKRHDDACADDFSRRGGLAAGWMAIPCGACEACRRLVVILRALGYDPQALGYSPVKIEKALAHAMRVTSPPPEAKVQRHVMYLLGRSRDADAGGGGQAPAESAGKSTFPGISAARLEPCPEVEALRFDGIRSFMDTIPLPFRRGIYEILLRHAAGALRREGREWKTFDPLVCLEMEQPKRLLDSQFSSD